MKILRFMLPCGCHSSWAHIATCLDPDDTLRREDDAAERYAALRAIHSEAIGVTLDELTRYLSTLAPGRGLK